MSKSNWTLRHPRTLDEAFGDGTPRVFADNRRRVNWDADVVIGVVSAVATVVVIALSFAGVV